MTGPIRNVVLTRPADAARPWQRALEALGLTVFLWPCIEVRLCAASARERTALTQALDGTPAPWLVCTSQPGVRGIAAWLRACGRALPPRLCCAAVGPATAALMRAELGVDPVVAEPHTGVALGALLRERLPRTSCVLLPQSPLASPALAATLREPAHTCVPLAVYETLPFAPTPGCAPTAPPWGEVHTGWQVVVASPSAVTGLVGRIGQAALPHVLALGPKTFAAAQAQLTAQIEMASEASLAGVLRWFRRQRPC